MNNLLKNKILIVDDDDTCVFLLKNILKGFKFFDVDSASSGEIALEMLKMKEYDLVFLDYKMPGMSGLEVLKEIQKNDSSIPVIMVTGFSNFKNPADFINYGAFDYIPKPFDEVKLSMAITKALKMKKWFNQKKDQIDSLKSELEKHRKELVFQYEVLSQEQTRTEGILKNAGFGILVLDGETEEIKLINNEAQKFSGLHRKIETFFGIHYAEIFPDILVRQIKLIIAYVKINNEITPEHELKIDDNSVLRIIGYPVKKGDALLGITVIFEDITERKLLENQIIMASRLAGIGELAAGVAHEINNPVGFVNSNTFSMKKYFSKIKTMLDFYQNLIEDNRHKEFMQAYIDKLDILKMELKLDKAIKNIDDIIDENITGLERIAKIVQDLKTFAHFDQEMNSDVNINQILDNTLNLVNNEIKYKATVKKNYTELPPIKCNEGQISQIFANILVNAAQAIEKEGIIEISTYHIDSKIFIEIKDNGCGMPKENLNKIFNAFFTTKKTGKGTGLGLSIVYKIIEKHKGDIKVESELGKGTKFTIILPVCASVCINDKTEIQKIETKEEKTKVPCIDYYL